MSHRGHRRWGRLTSSSFLHMKILVKIQEYMRWIAETYIKIYSYIIPTLGPKGTQWGTVKLICMSTSSSLFLSLCMSLCLSIWLSVSIFGNQSTACRICRLMPGVNSLSGSITCLSVRPYVRSSICPVVHGTFVIFYLYSTVLILEMITITITITSVGVQSCGEFVPVLGSKGPQWGPVKLMYVRFSTCPPLSLSVQSSASLFDDHPRNL